nr:MAG TPA_asm: hypothetical protein [Bacteriophage sp.]
MSSLMYENSDNATLTICIIRKEIILYKNNYNFVVSFTFFSPL